jgi:Glycosyl hydrolase family 65, N-terminal domain
MSTIPGHAHQARHHYGWSILKREIVPPPEHLFPPDVWRFVEARWTPEFSDRTETAFALSNGYVGVRGALDEARPSLDPGTFINGFHETWQIVHAEEAYGLARTGQTMCNVPDAMVLERSSTTSPCSCRLLGFASTPACSTCATAGSDGISSGRPRGEST